MRTVRSSLKTFVKVWSPMCRMPLLLTCVLGEPQVAHVDPLNTVHSYGATHRLEGLNAYGDFKNYFRPNRQIRLSSEKENPIGRIRDIKIRSNGNILIVDDAVPAIYEFSQEGIFIRTIGRFGRGPGEFTVPRSLRLDKNNNLYVLDTKQAQILCFNERGEFLRSISLGQPTTDFLLTEDSRFVVFHPMLPRTVTFFSSTGEVLHRISPNSLRYGISGGKIEMDKEGRIYELRPTSYKIYVHSSEGLFERSFGEKPLYYKPLSKPPAEYANQRELESSWTPMTGLFYLASHDILICQMRRGHVPNAQFFISLYKTTGEMLAKDLLIPGYIIATDRRNSVYLIEKSSTEAPNGQITLLECELTK